MLRRPSSGSASAGLAGSGSPAATGGGGGGSSGEAAPAHDLGILDVPAPQLADATAAVVDTVIFLRAFGPVSSATRVERCGVAHHVVADEAVTLAVRDIVQRVVAASRSSPLLRLRLCLYDRRQRPVLGGLTSVAERVLVESWTTTLRVSAADATMASGVAPEDEAPDAAPLAERLQRVLVDAALRAAAVTVAVPEPAGAAALVMPAGVAGGTGGGSSFGGALGAGLSGLASLLSAASGGSSPPATHSGTASPSTPSAAVPPPLLWGLFGEVEALA